MVKLGIFGSTGRMGQEIIATAASYPHQISEVLAYKREDDLNDFCGNSNIILDFSSPEGTASLISAITSSTAKLLVGTTGLSPEIVEQLKALSASRPVMLTPNTSLGVNLIMALTRQVAAFLDNSYDIEIVDIHHRFKKDAPSGTALKLAEIAKTARGARNLPAEIICSNAERGLRQEGEIGISSLRLGSIPSHHQVLFSNLVETITISHETNSRRAQADGAIKAGLWLNAQNSGFYNFEDMLGL